MKDSIVSYCADCTECCIDPHKPNKAKKHNEISLKRFKNKIDQYLSQDDWLWEDALGIEYKLEELQNKIKTLKIRMMETVYEKKLAYALQWDTADKIVQSFKAARDGNFDKLTCANAFRVYEKVDRSRNVNEREVKRLAKEIIDDTKLAVQGIVKDWAKSNQVIKGRYQKQEDKGDRARYRDERPPRQERDLQRQERRRPPRQDSNQKVSKIEFGNSFPVLKINQIQQAQTHFNVVVKVIKIHKEFRIGPINKIEFTGGDSSGIATVVVDLSRFIRVGAAISISKARVYDFHGIKQIQQSGKQSEIKQERIVINVDESYNFSQKKGKYVRGGRNDDREDRGSRVQHRQDRREDKREDRRGDRRVYRREDKERDQRSQIVQRPNRQEERLNKTSREDKPPKRRDRYSDQEEEEKPVRRAQQKPKAIEKVPERNFNKKKQQSSQSQSEDEDETKIEQQTKVLNKAVNIAQIKLPNITKIKDIEPADEDLTIIAQIVTIHKGDVPGGIKPEKGHFICILGDDTAIIRAQLPKHSQAVKEGVVVKINNVNSVVDSDHRITLKLGEEGICERTNIKIPKVNITLNQSQEQWQSDQQQGQEEQQQQGNMAIVEDF